MQNPTRDNYALDFVLATNDELIENVNVGEEFSNSDDRAITFEVNESNISKEKSLTTEKQISVNSNHCLTKSTGVIYVPPHINVHWKFFKDRHLKVVQRCVPMKNRRPTKNVKPKWWNT